MNRPNEKPTVTIAICAYNEGPNIEHLLKTVVIQQTTKCVIEQIYIISDGSEDDTVEKIKAFKDDRIVLKDYKERKGKSFRLNEIYSTIKSDFMVQPDADVLLATPHVIEAVVEPMIENEKVGMTGGNSKATKTETLVEKAVNCTHEAYQSMREHIRRGNNVYTATGRLIALRREAYENLTVPHDTISNDHFVYFCIITKGFEYRYAPDAVVYFRLPQTLADHVNQETRFSSAEHFMKRYFPTDVVDREYAIPREEFVSAVVRQFVKHPFLCVTIFGINLYCKFMALFTRYRTNALWDVVYSTKVIKHAKK
ncbi:hypothetical protein BH09PAT2_BH09PAT2_01980 [soil metagenome]